MPERTRRVRDPEGTELRDVRVDEPQLSDSTNRLLTRDLQQVIGAERVEVPADRPHPSKGDRPKRHGPLGLPLPRNFIVTQAGAGALVFGAIVALITRDWWLLPPAVIVLGLVTWVVVAVVLRMTANPERPAPSTVAAMEEDGIQDPERHFSDIVAEFTVDTGAQGQNRRTTSVDDDPVKGAAEHRSAITPSSGATGAVGPESHDDSKRDG